MGFLESINGQPKRMKLNISRFWHEIKSLKHWFIIAYNSWKFKKNDFANPMIRDIEDATDFALNNAKYYIGYLPGNDAGFLKDKVLLEIGPGQDFGLQLLLLGFGAKKIILVDKYLSEWNENYHPLVYKRLLVKAEIEFPEVDFRHLKEVIHRGSHQIDGLEMHHVGLESISLIASNSVDITFSNACFEHLLHSEKAIKQLARISKVGGLGFHQIDFRDHRDYERPLEFLTFSNFSFKLILKLSNCCFGNRLRHQDFANLFAKNGFNFTFKADIFADESYLDEVLERSNSKFRKMSKEEIAILSGQFRITKI
jgi:SAM-dependent methyltransferase